MHLSAFLWEDLNISYVDLFGFDVQRVKQPKFWCGLKVKWAMGQTWMLHLFFIIQK